MDFDSGAQPVQGPDLEVIQTEAVGFLSIAADAKVRLTSPWGGQLPSCHASLMSIASRRGLVAAAGPDAVIVATTESVRKAFETPKDAAGSSDLRPFDPQIRLPMPMRVSQLAFSADENLLLLSAETGGGIAVYDVTMLLQGQTQPSLELSTNGEALRALAPNPTREKAELCAVVTEAGNLYMANLKERTLGQQPLRNQVSSVGWSTRGKQLVAGLVDGTIAQMTPEGAVKAMMPKPPSVGDNYHVSSVLWLENNVLLVIHTSTAEQPAKSVYNVITRQPPSAFSFQKLTDPVDPYGSDRPLHHAICRLREFAPHLTDLLIVASTASAEIGLLSRAKEPLTGAGQATESATNLFTTTEMADDTNRATLPMTESLEDSVAIGLALDLSSRETVYKPIPKDEIEESVGPLPGFWTLTHEGVLCAWWVVYRDSIRQGLTYQGMAAAEGEEPGLAQPAHTPATPATNLGAPFGTPGATPAPAPFGTSGATPAPALSFGGPSSLGARASPWGAAAGSTSFGASAPAVSNTPAFGTPAFGSPAFGTSTGAAFGQSGGLGFKASPWATTGTSSGGSAPVQSAFAAAANNDAGQKSVFGTSGPRAAGGGGFAGFASQGGFRSLGGGDSGTSIFAAKPGGSVGFGSRSDLTMDTDTAFPPPKPDSAPMDGFSGFKLESTFKRDPMADNDGPAPAAGSSSMFGSSFGAAIGGAPTQPPPPSDVLVSPPSKEEEMGAEVGLEDTPTPDATPSKEPSQAIGSTTPMTPSTTPAPSRVFGMPDQATEATPPPISGGSGSAAGASGSLFGGGKQDPKTPDEPAGTSSGSLFSSVLFGSSRPAKEGDSETDGGKAAPLPPESRSRVSFALPDSNNSSTTSRASDGGPVGASGNGTDPETASDVLRTPPSSSKASSPKQAVSSPLTADSATGEVDGAGAAESLPSLVDDALPSDREGTVGHSRKVADPLLPVVSGPLRSATIARSDRITKRGTRRHPAARTPLKSAVEVPLLDSAEDDDTVGDDDSNDDVSNDDDNSNGDDSNGDDDNCDADNHDVEDEDEDEDGHDMDDDDDGDAFSEGSGIDVANELSPSTTGTGPAPQSAAGSQFKIPRVDVPRSGGLFGEVKEKTPAPFFPQPEVVSPRSPSPIRSSNAKARLRKEPVRSVSAPGMASQLLSARRSQLGSGPSILGPARSVPDMFVQQPHALSRAEHQQREADEALMAENEDSERMRQLLQSEPEPSLTLDSFVAHSYVTPPAQEAVPAQVEAVFRDINSMVDTVGLNGRSLAAFVSGHSTLYSPGGRTIHDLENPDGWVLCEVAALTDIIEHDLAADLEQGRVRDVPSKLEACRDLNRDMSRLRAMQNELHRIAKSKTDSDGPESARGMPLTPEQTAQRDDLRREYGRFSRLLSETEEALTLLKTRIASAGGGTGATNMPTVDAVIRTINKMTSIAEKRSGDVDVLENQMRKMGLGSSSAVSGRSISREGTPVGTIASGPSVTPQKKSAAGLGASTSSLILSPEPAAAAGIFTPNRRISAALAGSITPGSRIAESPARRRLSSGFSQEDKEALREKRTKRKAVIDRLEAIVVQRGVAVWQYDDEDPVTQ